MDQQNDEQATIIEDTEVTSEPLDNIESDLIAQPSPEYLQKKLYFLLEQLKVMHAALPELIFTNTYLIVNTFSLFLLYLCVNIRSYQMRIPYELLTGLANSLLNDTIFEIVKGLMEIQHVTEKHLLQLRNQVETEHESE